ncbi:MAG TPA: hypothetical protein PK156_20585 [Polyangium sp.]|nr:hypothetical protein [Polyangium sp.]
MKRILGPLLELNRQDKLDDYVWPGPSNLLVVNWLEVGERRWSCTMHPGYMHPGRSYVNERF